jgi:hypothetical protein
VAQERVQMPSRHGVAPWKHGSPCP